MFRILTFPLRLVWNILVVLVPLIGVWVASSLTAYLNGPIWAACLVGALLFPVLPLAWEWRANAKRRRKLDASDTGDKEPKRWLGFWDRVTLRTLFLNVAFLGILLASFPAKGFTALSTRGDWMLQGDQSERAETVRQGLFQAANGLAWLHELATDNPFERYDDGSSKGIEPAPNPVPIKPDVGVPEEPVGTEEPARTTSPVDTTPEKREPGEVPAWPMRAELHPVVANLPAEHEKSIESVAKYIASQEPDPFLRVKALHDYVADRVSYDIAALRRGDYPPQDEETVFRTRMAVCAGYATLLVKMGEYTGDEIVYVAGNSRGENGQVAGGGHAWNAAKIEGRWYLLDATWSAGYVNGSTFTKSYSTANLFTPPEVFVHDHLPDNSSWQLLETPITQGEFVRQPMMKARFFAKGYELLSPRRSQISVSGDGVELEIKSKRHIPMIAQITPRGADASTQGVRCEVNGLDLIKVSCETPTPGQYTVWLFSKDKGVTYGLVGHLEVNRS